MRPRVLWEPFGMKILFFTSSSEDYLADGVLHGLRSLLGGDVIDYPKAERLYKNCPVVLWKQIRGSGFTLYGLLDDIEVDRHNVYHKARHGFFDLIIIGDIGRQFGAFVQCLAGLRPSNTVILDGSDSEAPYPYGGWCWRNPRYWFLPRANKFLYFKRELTPRTLHYRSFLLIPEIVCKLLPYPKNWRPISFSIPAAKINGGGANKTKLFTKQIVDPEVARKSPARPPTLVTTPRESIIRTFEIRGLASPARGRDGIASGITNSRLRVVFFASATSTGNHLLAHRMVWGRTTASLTAITPTSCTRSAP